jgi:probable F420-dependent oxidoreductase
MKSGVTLPNYGPAASVEALFATARTAERLGFDSAWATDHILLPREDAERFGFLYEAIATLAYLAGSTTHMRLGVSSLVLPQRNPVIVAKQIATLDTLSGGRAILCASAGWSRGEYANLGQSFNNRGKRLDEGIRVMRRLWQADASSEVGFKGEFYHFTDAVFAPSPAQPGGPPIWIGGNSEAAMRRAIRLGDAWHPSSLGLEDFRRKAARFRELIDDQTISNPRRRIPIRARIRISFDGSDPSAQIKGSPSQVLDTLKAYQEEGLDYAVLTFPARTQVERETAMTRFAKDVMPAFSEKEL